MIGQGVTLLVGGSGRFGHQPRYAAFLTASPIFPHSSLLIDGWQMLISFGIRRKRPILTPTDLGLQCRM